MPAYSRAEIVNENEVSSYHCISRCVRRSYLCGYDKHSGNNYEHRKAWLAERLELLKNVFAIEISHYAIMENHYHLQVTLRPDKANAWSDEEIIERWWQLFPRKGEETLPDEIRQNWLGDQGFLAIRRQRLSSLSWFMKCLNEPIAKRANKEDRVNGSFWQGRFISKRILDDEAATETGLYIDLNPIKAGKAERVEDCDNTSVEERALALLAGGPLKLLIPIKAILGQFEQDAPYLLEDEKDYVNLVRVRAQELLAKNAKTLALNRFVSICATAIGSSTSLEREAAKRKKKWLKGVRLARQLLG